MSNLRIIMKDGKIEDTAVLTDKLKMPLVHSIVLLLDPHSAVARITYFTDKEGEGETVVETVDIESMDIELHSPLVAKNKVPFD